MLLAQARRRQPIDKSGRVAHVFHAVEANQRVTVNDRMNILLYIVRVQ
jgi:hypothetical protein